MEISNIKQSNILSFSSRKLFNISLLYEKDFSPVKTVRAFISELNREDLARLDEQRDYWDFSIFGQEIIADFKKKIANISLLPKYWGKRHFYAVEIPETNAQNRIVSLAEATVGDRDVRLNYIQSADTTDSCEVIQGGGSGLLYAIEKLAEKLGKTRINLDADARAIGFYVKNGFHNDFYKYFSLSADKFENFKRRLEQKYAITQIPEK